MNPDDTWHVERGGNRAAVRSLAWQDKSTASRHLRREREVGQGKGGMEVSPGKPRGEMEAPKPKLSSSPIPQPSDPSLCLHEAPRSTNESWS